MKQHKIKKGYIIYSNGEVFSIESGRFLIPYENNSGYFGVTVAGRKYMLHRLIAETFIENPERKKCVDHIDGNRKNNDVRNLQWLTHVENVNKSYQQSGLDQYRNYTNCNLLVDNVIVDTFRSVKECADYAEMNYNVSASSLRKYYANKNVRIEKC